MSDDFHFFKLGELTEIIAGGDKPKSFTEIKTNVNCIPVYGNAENNNGLLGYTDVPKILEAAVTISARGSKVGFTSIRKQPFFPIVRLLTLIPFKKKLDVNFLYYNLQQNRQGGTGSGQPQITIPEISNKYISIPSLPIQRKIAAVLSSLDDKIELNNRINAKLEQMAKTLYDYWFVQFDFPNAVGKPYKSSGGEMVYSEVLKRKIPKGFQESQVGEIAKLIRGVSYSKNDIENKLTEKNIRILRATNITGNKIDLNNPIIVSKDFVSKDQILEKFEILITMSSGSIDHIGKNGFYYFGDEVSYGAFCAKLVANDTYKYFLLSYMQSSFVSSTIKNECLGTNINNLNGAMVNAFKIIKPPHNILQKFNEIVIPLHEKISVNLQQNQQLAQLRDWLLPMLMNGQVTVGEAEDKEGELGIVDYNKSY